MGALARHCPLLVKTQLHIRKTKIVLKKFNGFLFHYFYGNLPLFGIDDDRF